VKHLEGSVVFLFGLVKLVDNPELASQIITNNARGKCLNPSRVHFCGHVDCEVLMKVLGPTKEQVMRGCRKLLSEEGNDLYSSLNVTIKSKTVSRTCSMYVRE
jgi:hypothetical protein